MIWLIIELSILLFTLFFIFSLWFNRNHSYFEKHNVPFIPPTKFFGSLKDMVLFKVTPTQHWTNLYNHGIAKNNPFVGVFMFHRPALLIRDPELIKQLFVRDFNFFSDRGSEANPNFDPLGAYSLFFLKNPEWKIIRSSMTPFFSSGKIKQMFYLVNEAASELDSFLCNLSSNKQYNFEDFDFKELNSRYTTDVIASVGFGITANSIKNPNAEFRKKGSSMINFTWRRAIDFSTIFLLPELVPYLKSKLFSNESTKFLRNVITFTMEERIRTGEKRKDLIDILIELQNTPDDENAAIKMKGDVLIAQAAIFFLAGFETSSSTMTFGLYELAKNQKVQNRVRKEIQDVLKKHNGKISYESLSEMEYLTAVVHETLRFYPLLPLIERKCTPPSDQNGYSLKPYSDFVIPKGMSILAAVQPIQHNSKYFDEPHKFNPERMLTENKLKQTPCTNMSFGLGPRACIGERLGILQSKLGLLHILKNHSIKLCKKTPMTLSFDKKAFILQFYGPLNLHVIRDPLF